MSKELMIEAFEAAKRKNIPFGRFAYRNPSTNCYCAVGWMARYMGIPDREIQMQNLGSPGESEWSTLDRLKRYYGIDTIGEIIERNDNLWYSWDDAIAFVRGL